MYEERSRNGSFTGEGNYLVKKAGISDICMVYFENLLPLQSRDLLFFKQYCLLFFKEKQTWKETINIKHTEALIEDVIQ